MYPQYEFGSPARMQGAVQNARLSMLEIGAGRYSPIIRRGSGIVHVGINVDPLQHAYLADDTGRDNFAVYCDLRVLGGEGAGQDPAVAADQREYFDAVFEGCRFDALMIRNVFGEDQSKNHYPGQVINPSGRDYNGSSGEMAKFSSLLLGLELLKRGGKLTIEETLSSWVGAAGKLKSNPNILLGFGLTAINPARLERNRGESMEDYVLRDPYRITARKM